MGTVYEPMNNLVQMRSFLLSESGGIFKVCSMSLQAPSHLLVQTLATCKMLYRFKFLADESLIQLFQGLHIRVSIEFAIEHANLLSGYRAEFGYVCCQDRSDVSPRYLYSRRGSKTSRQLLTANPAHMGKMFLRKKNI